MEKRQPKGTTARGKNTIVERVESEDSKRCSGLVGEKKMSKSVQRKWECWRKWKPGRRK